MNFFRRLFKKDRNNPPECLGTKMPDNWNLTIADLFEEMKAGIRKSVGSPEADWAREYERSQIPSDTRFPKKGDVYESLRDQTIEYMTAWAAPYTGGGKGTLLEREQVWIDSDPRDEKPIGVYALPMEYGAIEQRMVPQTERENTKYGGFYFYFSTLELNQNFKLIKTGFKKCTT